MVLQFYANLMKQHKPLVPLFACVGFGVVLAGAYVMRLTFHPHTVWSRSDPYPWLHIKYNENIKLYSVSDAHLDVKEDPRSYE
eukprot:CAMPEP_0204579284 /NCGR_PEP_ID=MMETSP0661-20131031/43404_1 /ASSEMBLY_ACC=CAM_ASM_000606 /TAXON_ID=109239 /ORGANISM="Alexandrium margalefi, Strain AMGDE01CS-322" /LENGTH=82 /DNA_ID=CAMNT_0051588281 /DNA_START=27 /DNA_END=275 /DNA_ORIENTATION=-